MFRSDRILWYNVGVWGELGYAAPNLGDNVTTLNSNVHYLVDVMGRNLAAVLQAPDADLRTPPNINTLMRVSRLCERARSVLASRSVGPAEPMFEATHATPAAEVFNLFPVPYFRIRNAWLKEWAGYILLAISEACQHTDNRQAFDVSSRFAGTIGQYVHRVYQRLATELLGAQIEEARKLDYTIPAELWKTFDPGKFFTSTELIDTIPPPHRVPTEDDLVVLTDGIPANVIHGLMAWPFGGSEEDQAAAGGQAAATSTSASFAPPPGP